MFAPLVNTIYSTDGGQDDGAKYVFQNLVFNSTIVTLARFLVPTVIQNSNQQLVGDTLVLNASASYIKNNGKNKTNITSFMWVCPPAL